MARKDLPTVEQEALLWEQGSAFVFGVDEVGRGCLAGPVCAGAVCWAPFSTAFGLPANVRDSKVMSEIQREAAFEPVRALCLAHGVGYASAREIDEWNILRATHLALARALESAFASLALRGLLHEENLAQIAFLADGNRPMVSHTLFFVRRSEFAPEFPWLSRLLRHRFTETCLVKGDSKVFSIASASVIAKVSRDRLMAELHRTYPDYEFAQHKGYSTPAHIEKLRAHGPCFEHRRSFSPVSEAFQLFP